MKKILLFLFFTTQTYAIDWSMNIAYNNPPGANGGFNFMAEEGDFALELGLGIPDFSKSDTLRIWGDVDVKYLGLSSGSFRPYIQIGFMQALQGSLKGTNDLAADYGGAYGGVGFFFRGSSLYAYTSVNKWIGHDSIFYQFGIGLDI